MTCLGDLLAKKLEEEASAKYLNLIEYFNEKIRPLIVRAIDQGERKFTISSSMTSKFVKDVKDYEFYSLCALILKEGLDCYYVMKGFDVKIVVDLTKRVQH